MRRLNFSSTGQVGLNRFFVSEYSRTGHCPRQRQSRRSSLNRFFVSEYSRTVWQCLLLRVLQAKSQSLLRQRILPDFFVARPQVGRPPGLNRFFVSEYSRTRACARSRTSPLSLNRFFVSEYSRTNPPRRAPAGRARSQSLLRQR